ALEQRGNDDMKATAKKLRKIEKEVLEFIEESKKSIQQFVDIPSVVIKDTLMRGLQAVVLSGETIFKTAQASVSLRK
ncbi:hypothetical protein PMAYCL1PPCAC_33304, partial [Pristionchus mayeri]